MFVFQFNLDLSPFTLDGWPWRDKNNGICIIFSEFYLTVYQISVHKSLKHQRVFEMKLHAIICVDYFASMGCLRVIWAVLVSLGTERPPLLLLSVSWRLGRPATVEVGPSGPGVSTVFRVRRGFSSGDAGLELKVRLDIHGRKRLERVDWFLRTVFCSVI